MGIDRFLVIRQFPTERECNVIKAINAVKMAMKDRGRASIAFGDA